jgi:DNA-binding GntR family transcriptional regulator
MGDEGSPLLYVRTAARIAERIVDGTYPPGGQLPGEAALAEEFGVSRLTLRHALVMLRDRGLVGL